MARKRLRLTQREVAGMILVSVSTYRNWEKYGEPNSLDVVARLCRVLGISMEWYVNGEEFKALSADQRKVLRHFDQLSERQRRGFLEYIDPRRL